MAVNSETLEQAFDIKTESEFIQACIDGDLKTVSESLKKDSSLANKPATDGRTPLMFAAEQGRLRVVEALLAAGAEIDAVGGAGSKRIWSAASNKQLKIDVLQPASDGRSPLVFTAEVEKERIRLEKVLLAASAEIDAVFKELSQRKPPAIWWAASKKQWEVVKLLLRRGAKNLDASPAEGEHRGKTALWFASNDGEGYTVGRLLEEGAKNLDASPAEGEHRGKTALWFAACAGAWEYVDQLLRRGAKDLDASPAEGEHRGKTALWYAACAGRWDIVGLLLKKNAKNLDASPIEGVDRGKTALWYAACAWQWDIVRFLLELEDIKNLDASPAEGERQGATALWYAACAGQWDIIRLLLAKGAKGLDARQRNREATALWYVACAGRWDIFRSLLEGGAEQNLDTIPAEESRRGGLPVLWYAACAGQWRIVRLLLEKGVKQNLDVSPAEGENAGLTALWFAIKAQRQEIVLLLKEKGAKKLDALHTDASFTPQFDGLQGKSSSIKISAEEVQKFLDHVVAGEQSKAEEMLKARQKRGQNLALATAAGTVTDHAGRMFKDITGFQYAVWSLDWQMWKMIRNYLPDKVAQEQARGFTRGSWVKEHGEHAEWKKLIEVQQTFLDNVAKHDANSQETGFQEIGSAQRLLPIHVLQEYEYERSFKPCPKFDAESNDLLRARAFLTKNNMGGMLHHLKCGNTVVVKGSSLKSEWYMKGKFKRAHETILGEYLKSDKQALSSLYDIRLQQREELVSELLKPVWLSEPELGGSSGCLIM